jgi:hypothetical protein
MLDESVILYEDMFFPLRLEPHNNVTRIDVFVVERVRAACLPRSDRTNPSAWQPQRSWVGREGSYDTHHAFLARGAAQPGELVVPGWRGVEPSAPPVRGRRDGRW